MPSEDFSDFLNNISSQPLYVIDDSIPISQYTSIDLSENNSDLKHFDVSSSLAWQEYITHYLQGQKKAVAYGGYLEQRNIYRRSSYFNSKKEEERNIHLGVDLWSSAQTKVLTPLDATIHSFKNNTNFGDYGPTIILQHHIENETFFTLYGHLSLESIAKLSLGQTFKAGDCIARLGYPDINGDYAPHLHFQIVRNIGNYFGDYPGVSSQKNLDNYIANCPDPNTLLKLNLIN